MRILSDFLRALSRINKWPKILFRALCPPWKFLKVDRYAQESASTQRRNWQITGNCKRSDQQSENATIVFTTMESWIPISITKIGTYRVYMYVKESYQKVNIVARYSSINTHHYKYLFILITDYHSYCLHRHCIVQGIVYFIIGIIIK